MGRHSDLATALLKKDGLEVLDGRGRWVKTHFSRMALWLCVVVQAASWSACKRGPCDAAVALKTPALYLQHVGDEDKPIEPIVLGTRAPTISECRCAAPSPLISPYGHIYTITNEEFRNTVQMIDGYKNAKPVTDRGEYRYVLVRGPGAVQIGQLERDQSKSLFATLESYFKEREPQVYSALSAADREF